MIIWIISRYLVVWIVSERLHYMICKLSIDDATDKEMLCKLVCIQLLGP